MTRPTDEQLDGLTLGLQRLRDQLKAEWWPRAPIDDLDRAATVIKAVKAEWNL